MPSFDVDAITLDSLRRRRSAKWRTYDADVLPSWIAEMDFPLAEPIAATLHEAVSNSDTGYLAVGDLREAFAGFALESWGWQVEPSRVAPLPDVLTGITQALLHMTAPGDGIVINPPVYHPFYSCISEVAQRTVVEVPMCRNSGGRYDWDLDALERAFARPDVTAYLMSNPHNPTGTVATAAALVRIAALAAQHGVAVIADEVHGPLVLAGAMHVPYLTVADDDANAVVLTSASKAWNTAGLKCAQLVSTRRTAVTLAARIPLEVTYGTSHFGVMAGIAAYRDGRTWLADVLNVLDANRTLLAGLIAQELPKAWHGSPDASYLAWIDFAAYGLGDDPAAVMLERGRVALGSGPTFGTGGAGFARLNFATSPAILREIVQRVATVVQ